MHVAVKIANFLESVKFYHALNASTKSIMRFIFKPTLEHIALMKLVSTLWNQHDIRLLLEEFSNTVEFLQVDDYFEFPKLIIKENWTGEKEEKWQTITTRVTEKIPQDLMQIPLKDRIVGYIKPVGLQILRWMEYHRKCFCLNLKLPSEFCWTLQGIIDKKKTAKVLIKDEDISIITRYKLACIYCLEHDIVELWNKIPENLKVVFNNGEDLSDPTKISEFALASFWNDFTTRNLRWDSKIIIKSIGIFLQSYYSNALQSAVIMASTAATEYFLSKVDQSQELLVNAAILVLQTYADTDVTISDPPKEYYVEILHFLLSRMNDMQQLRVFETYTASVLVILLEWPCQTFFIETAKHLCRIFPENFLTLFKIATGIVRKVKLGYRDYNYRKMYRKVWQQLPDAFKKHVINDTGLPGLIRLLLEIKDSENIKLMFQHISIEGRGELVFSEAAVTVCRTLAKYEEWDLLKFFVQLCVASKNEMIRFKEKIMERNPGHSWKVDWNKLSHVLDDLDHAFDKRNGVHEDECSAAKRICNSSTICEEESQK